MRSFKKFGVLLAVFALSAIGAANASAATFTASATGSLTGMDTADQIFTINGGQVRCTVAHSTGSIVSTASPEQKVKVKYSGCTAFGFANVHISEAEYNFTANGTVHVLNTITINVTLGGCTVTVKPQTVNKVSYTNSGGKLTVSPAVTGITYTSTGGLCGSSGANGTYTGANLVERVGGGSISWDA